MNERSAIVIYVSGSWEGGVDEKYCRTSPNIFEGVRNLDGKDKGSD